MGCCWAESLSRVWLFATPWTVACQAPLSMGFSRQEYWSGLPCPSPGDLPNPGVESRSPTLQVGSLSSEPPGGLQPNLEGVSSGQTSPRKRCLSSLVSGGGVGGSFVKGVGYLLGTWVQWGKQAGRKGVQNKRKGSVWQSWETMPGFEVMLRFWFWFEIRLPMQALWVWSLIWEDPTCRRAAMPVGHSYWGRAPEPKCRNYWAHCWDGSPHA